MKKILATFLIFFLSSQNIFATDFSKIKERPVQNNYHFTSYFPSMDELYKYRKAIVIDTKIGNLKAYFYGQEIWSFDASVGKYNFETPKGKFRIVQKNRLPKSKTSGLYMPFWMEFRGNGKYGIHGFPLYPNKTPKYPNEDKFSRTKLAGGCVRVQKENIKILYDWVELLTTVIIL
ncbi:L,D-transpeptidase [Candidatus Gracilibacteria bacterium]|nr:L,D-transpeptidase [Candidatus Gracilibacteria bacterium]